MVTHWHDFGVFFLVTFQKVIFSVAEEPLMHLDKTKEMVNVQPH